MPKGHPGFNPGPSELGLGGAGKGSVERGSKWRKKYDDIDWQKDKKDNQGFRRVGINKTVKKYG